MSRSASPAGRTPGVPEGAINRASADWNANTAPRPRTPANSDMPQIPADSGLARSDCAAEAPNAFPFKTRQ